MIWGIIGRFIKGNDIIQYVCFEDSSFCVEAEVLGGKHENRKIFMRLLKSLVREDAS